MNFFKNNKQAKEINKVLDHGKNIPKELDDAVKMIKHAAPEAANSNFKEQLKQKMMEQHKASIASVNTISNSEPVIESNQKTTMKNINWNPFRNLSFRPSKIVPVMLAVIVVLIGSYPLIPAPRVDGYTQAGRTVQISYNAPIKVRFSQLMAPGSAEAAFSIEPKVEGHFKWSGATMMFYPDEQFKEGDLYKVTVSKDAKSIFFKNLQTDYFENFKIIGPPEATLITPADATTEVPVESKITFSFDRPVRALEPLKEIPLSELGIKIDPPLNGRVKLLGTSAFQFIPERLQFSTNYNVTLAEGLETLDGGTTEKEYSVQFQTERPRVLNINPPSGTNNLGYKPELAVNFNQPMDLGRLNDSIFLYELSDEEVSSALNNGYLNVNTLEKMAFSESTDRVASPLNFRYANKEELSEKDEIKIEHGLMRDTSKNTVVIQPKNTLPLDKVFALIINENLRGAEGEVTMGEQRKHFIKTAGPLKVNETNPNPNQTDAYASSGINVIFNNPIKEYEEAELDRLVKIDQAAKGEKWVPELSPYNKSSMYIGGGLKPSAEYTVTVSGDIEDEYGQKMGDDYTFTFKTKDLDPFLDVPAPYSVNILDSNKPIEYFIKSTNVKKANFKFKSLNMEEFYSMYKNGYLNYREAKFDGEFEQRTIELSYKFNEQQFTRLNLEDELGSSIQPGIYYLEVWSDEFRDYQGTPYKNTLVMMVSDAALTYKHSKDHVLVWATSMKDGSPVSGMDIQIKSLSGDSVAQGTTNSDGIFEAKIKDPDNGNFYNHPEFNVIGTKYGSFAFLSSSWQEGVAAWNFNISSSYLPTKYYSTIYTERPLYRPGDTVYFKGIIREAGNTSIYVPSLNSTSVSIKDSRGNLLFDDKLAINKNGTFNGELKLETSASTGNYSISASIDGNDDAYGNFTVNEYRKPDYKVSMEPKKEDLVQGDKVEVDVTGEFFFGAPLSNAPIEWRAQSSDYYFNSYDGDLWYSFSEEGYLCYWGCSGSSDIVGEGKGNLDKNGKYTISFDSDFKDKDLSQIYSIEATAFDQNNQSVSNRVSLPVHQGEYYVGIANDDYVVKVGDDAKFNLISVDFEGNPVGGKNVEVSFYEREWNTVKKKNVDGGFYYESEYEDKFIEQKNTLTGSDGKAQVSFDAKNGGLFRAVARSKDGRGNTVTAGTNVYISSSEFVYWGFDNNDQIEIIPDKQEYSLGDTAKLLIKSPYENVSALVTYERADVEYSNVINIESNSHTIEVPITDKFLPNMFVSVAIFKGSDHTAGLPELEDSENEREVAAFKVGYTTLHVNTEEKMLDIDLGLNKGENAYYLPGEEVTVYVETKDHNGNPHPAEVSIAVVDESVLSLTNKVVADLIKIFYRDRTLNVESAFSMTKALSRINVQIEAGLKGGGGGYADKRSTFKDTAFWVATLETDSSGKGQTSFTLPDNLTSWEVLAIGVSKDTLLGSQRISFKTQKDVMLRSVLPRFVSIDDKMKAGVIVHNNTDKAINLSLSVKSDEVSINGNKEQSIGLEAHGQQKILWDMEAPHDPSIKKVTLNFLAKDKSGSGLGDQLELSLPLKATSFPEHVATSGSLTEDITKLEVAMLPDTVDKSLASLQIDVSPTFAGSLINGLEVSLDYPYLCSEQTASRILPNLKAKQVIELPIIPDDAIDMDLIDKNVESAISRLYGLQNANGGWGLWEDSKTSPYVTSHILLTLHEAQKAGYTVDQGAINRGLTYLLEYIKDTPLKGDYIGYEANQRSYMLFVMSELGKGSLALSNNLYEDRVNLSIFGKAYLAMSFNNLGNDNKANILKDEILTLREDTPRGISFVEKTHYTALFDTDVRSTAIVLQMLVRVDPDNDVIDKIIRFLLNERRGYNWSTTQESAITLTALLEYLSGSEEVNPNFSARVDLNKKEVIDAFFTTENIDTVTSYTNGNDLMNGANENEIAVTKSGSGKLYYDVLMEYFLPVEDIQERNEGMVIYQEYFRTDDTDELSPVHDAKVGENLKAKMTLVVPAPRDYVAVEDFLPAGLEGIDFSLNTAQQGLRDELDPVWSWFNNMWRFNHIEFRDDRVVYFADYLTPGVYEIEYFVRATTEGEFVDMPASAYQMYYPEVFGQTRGFKFKVTE